ncbi:hypothetical protein M0638_20515 [Roseomonas sp. NAR14]|uniref:Uncharacterized protein n=1 Tax=Roseomonas acroporae TaxID=2937791 RepID=A0A9X1YA82_9PROT|nr:hypothetical protein [Roseomonas acroporae]MCK8786759.1 hypothetical protein [Roseomonas acroporae]
MTVVALFCSAVALIVSFSPPALGPRLSECRSITDGTARLACYDRIAAARR